MESIWREMMKINSIQTNNVINAYGRQKQYAKGESESKQVKDKVTISEDAKYLSKITSDTDNIDLKKITEIKKKLESGTYSINSREIAKKMVESLKGEEKE